MRRIHSFLSVLFLLCALSLNAIAETQSASNQSEIPNAWQAFNKRTVEDYIVPAYDVFQRETDSLSTEINHFCGLPSKDLNSLDASQHAFHKAMDAWQGIQNIQFGPVQLLMRNYSIQFWPDKKNHVGKHLATLIHANDPSELEEEAFRKTSVSLKGLPALERLLFEEEFQQLIISNSYPCQVMQTIASYLANTALALTKEWKENDHFQDQLSASTTLIKALIEPIEVIRDLKVLRPMGSEFGAQRVTRMESWRSIRSLKNIQRNIVSLQDLYKQLMPLLSSEEKIEINLLFDSIINNLNAFNLPLEKAIEDQKGYTQMLKLADQLKTLHDALDQVVASKGIHLGFNSRDGD